jgi:hypothetical protein
MSDETTPIESAAEQALPQVEPLSVTDKFIGILTEPAETYGNVRDAGPRKSDWVAPLLLLCVIAVLSTIVRFSNAEFAQTIRDQQAAKMQQMIDAGKMTQEQADQALDMSTRMQKIFAPVGALVGVPIVFFLGAMVFWLLVRYALKGPIAYSGMLSIVGLTLFIDGIDQIVSLIVGYASNNLLASFSPALFMKPDLQSTTYKLASALDPIAIWKYAVFAIGVKTVAKVSAAKAYGLVFGLFVLWVVAMSIFKFGMMG